MGAALSKPPNIRADYLGFRIAAYKFEAAKFADQRLSSVQEILMAIKLVKFYVWESSFEEQVSEVRLRAHLREHA